MATRVVCSLLLLLSLNSLFSFFLSSLWQKTVPLAMRLRRCGVSGE